MKQNPEFVLTKVAEICFLVPVGKAAVNFNSIISLNEMGQTIWKMLENDISAEQILKNILAEYNVSEEKAKNDIDSFIGTLRESGCIED